MPAVPLFRRKPIDPARAALLAGFEPIGIAVEAAQRALLTSIPTFRDDGAPLAVALAGFDDHLGDAERALAQWQAPEAMRDRVAGAIRTAREEAATLRLEPNSLVFEALNGRIGDILFPLEEVADLETELREALRSARG